MAIGTVTGTVTGTVGRVDSGGSVPRPGSEEGRPVAGERVGRSARSVVGVVVAVAVGRRRSVVGGGAGESTVGDLSDGVGAVGAAAGGDSPGADAPDEPDGVMGVGPSDGWSRPGVEESAARPDASRDPAGAVTPHADRTHRPSAARAHAVGCDGRRRRCVVDVCDVDGAPAEIAAVAVVPNVHRMPHSVADGRPSGASPFVPRP